MTATQQTWAIVAATVGAAFLGAVIAYTGTAYLQGRQARRDTRRRLEEGMSELLAAAQDVLIGARVIREAHQRRTKFRYYIRLVGMLVHAVPRSLTTWRDLTEYPVIRSVLGSALELDRELTDAQRIVALDAATVLTPKLNRYFAVVALLTLGQDKRVANAVRQLTPQVTALAEGTGANKKTFERLTKDVQKAMEDFRAAADQRLGNVKLRRSRRER